LTTTQVLAAAKSPRVKKKSQPTPLFNASSNQDLADPVLELLGFNSTAPKAKVSKGNKKKKRNAENPVSEIQHVAGSSKNSNKHKQPAADNNVENLQRPASVFTCCLA
jgi:hypothetical protein